MRRPERNAQRKPSAWRVPAMLLAASAMVLVLPGSITGRMSSMVQVLVPLQDAVNRVVGAARGAVGGDTQDTTGPTQRQLQSLRSAVVLLSAQNRTLRLENEKLTRVRNRGLGPRGRLLPARVIADDAVPWRDSKLILLGGASRHQAVISQHFSVDFSRGEGARSGMAVLAAEVLVGTIEQAGAFTSRVKLLSDVGTRMSVAIGRVEGTTFTSAGAAFWLVGKGGGRIEIRDVHHQYVNDGSVRIGDVVLTRDDDPHLPPSITIGTLTDVAPDPDNGLLYILQVDPGVDLEALRRVYVVDTGN